MVDAESLSATTSARSARFSFSKSGGRQGRRCSSSVQTIDSREAAPSGIEASSEKSFCGSPDSGTFNSTSWANFESDKEGRPGRTTGVPQMSHFSSDAARSKHLFTKILPQLRECENVCRYSCADCDGLSD